MKKRARKTRRRNAQKGLRPWKKLGFGGKIWRVVWMVLLIFFVFSICQVLLFKFVNPAYTPLMAIRHHEQKKDPAREVRCVREWVSVDDVAPIFLHTIDYSESFGIFLYHRGFIFYSMRRAYIKNERQEKDYLIGGSTISQQTAKNCFLYPARNWFRKGLETYYTVLIEAIWVKRRIMECYVNVIELGDGIYGVEAASQHYFGHSAKLLTKDEARQLAATIPCPLAGNPNHPNDKYLEMYRNIGSYPLTYDPMDWSADRSAISPKYRRLADRGLLSFLHWVIKHEWHQHSQ